MKPNSSIKSIYPNHFSYIINTVLFPLKMIIPQPLITKIPFFFSNEEIRFDLVLQHLKGNVLDIGCGNNCLLKKYRAVGGIGIGIDVYPWDGVDLVVDDSSELDFPDGSFQTISFVACFNHIPYREAVLREAYRLLSPDGRIVLTNLPPVLSRIWHAWNYFWSKDQQERKIKEGEIWGFRRAELIGILRKKGFQLKFFMPFSWKLNQLYIFEKAETSLL